MSDANVKGGIEGNEESITRGMRTDRVQPGDTAASVGPAHLMLRIGAFCAATWAAAAVLYFGRHSVALIVLSGVVALGGFDLFRPD